jgi:hypothetical protein
MGRFGPVIIRVCDASRDQHSRRRANVTSVSSQTVHQRHPERVGGRACEGPRKLVLSNAQARPPESIAAASRCCEHPRLPRLRSTEAQARMPGERRLGATLYAPCGAPRLPTPPPARVLGLYDAELGFGRGLCCLLGEIQERRIDRADQSFFPRSAPALDLLLSRIASVGPANISNHTSSDVRFSEENPFPFASRCSPSRRARSFVTPV